MRFHPLASSSHGNAYVLEDGETFLLIECGVTYKKLQKLMGFSVSQAAACLISHEHKDHAGCYDQLHKSGIPVYASAGTAKALERDWMEILEDREPVLVRETVSQSTCNFLKEALFQTVEVGTGSAAGVEGYHIGGKTGTAEKLPRSAKNYLVSFCGFAPVEDPQVVCYVIVDQPNAVGEAQAHSSFASGIFSKIMAEALPVLNQYPEGMDASEYRAPQTVLPGNEEGDSQTVMGSQESTEAESEQPTDEAGNPIENPSSAPAASEEFIQGDSGEDLELPEPALPGLQEMESSLAESAQASSAAASIAETADEAPPETAEAAEEETGDPSAGIRPGEAQATQNIEL